jgi:hypothetical protein
MMLLVPFQGLAQQGRSENHKIDSICSHYLYFVPPDKNLLSLVREWKSDEGQDTLFPRWHVSVLSTIDGSVRKEISIPDAREVDGFNLAHDGSSFVVMTGNEYTGKFELQKYSLRDSCWEWRRQWHGGVKEGYYFERDSLKQDHKKPFYETLALRVSYSKDDKKIECITAKNIVMVDAASGVLIRSSNSIAPFFASEDYHKSTLMRYALSSNGRFFAFWHARYLTWSSYSNEDIFTLIFDYAWYGVKWLFCLGSIPNNMYVWDVENDSLYCTFKIPYEEIIGVPAFTDDEERLLLGPVGNGTFRVYSLKGKNLERDFVQESFADSTISVLHTYSNGDYKVISPDNNLVAARYHTLSRPNDPKYGTDPVVLLLDFKDGKMIGEHEIAVSPSLPMDRYAVAFSSDSRYLAFVTYDHTVEEPHMFDSTRTLTLKVGERVTLYDTKTWAKIW